MDRIPLPWHGVLDDASVAVARFADAAGEEYADLLGSALVSDRDLDALSGLEPVPTVGLVVSGGAGGIVPALTLARRRGLAPARVEAALRDLDDLAGNARRVAAAVDQARAEGLVDDELPVHLGMPAAPAVGGWLGAADEASMAELRLTLRIGGEGPGSDPATIATWIDVALDRELPFAVTADELTLTARSGVPTGLLNLLAATAAAFDGESSTEVADLIGSPAVGVPSTATVATARRWFSSVAAPNALALAATLREVLGTGSSSVL